MSHEKDVAAFMRQMRESDPKRYAEVCDKYPILTDRTIKRRIERNRETGEGIQEILPLEVLE